MLPSHAAVASGAAWRIAQWGAPIAASLLSDRFAGVAECADSERCRVMPDSGCGERGLALVDYDNMRLDSPQRDDHELFVRQLVDRLPCAFRVAFPDVRELDIRLYGGWVDELGHFGPYALRLLPILPRLRGRRDGVIVRPSLATTLARFPDFVLQGTVRRRKCDPKRMQQKMVDGMMGFDAVFALGDNATRVGVITDDDDVIPATLAANAIDRSMFAWLRRRAPSSGLNDRGLHSRGMRVYQIPGKARP